MSAARLNAVVGVGVALFAAALHAGALRHGFVGWDDNRFITENPLFAAGGWTYVRAAITRVQFEAYHPLHLLSYLPDRWLWPHRAAGFHAVNLFLFALDVGLLFTLARRHACLAGSAVAALLFAAHPLCVEPVQWISGRKDLLAMAIFVGIFLVEDARDPNDRRLHPAGLALFAAAILAKSSTLCAPPLLWCWLVWMRGTTARTATFRAVPYALLGIFPAVAVVTIWRGNQMIPDRPNSVPVDVLATLATYARRAVWPNDLAAVYPTAMPAAVVSALLVGAFAVAVAITWRRWRPPARFALVSFPVALLPVANIVPVNFRFADRYAFLALGLLVPPVAIGFAALFRGGNRFRSIAIGGATAALLLLGAVTLTLVPTWASSRALWAHATAIHPDAYMARLEYGETLAALHDWPGARNEYQAVVRLLPKNSFGYTGLVFVYASRAEEQGRIPSGTARKWLEELSVAQKRSTDMDALMTKVRRAACIECADTLLLLRLRRWPKPDDSLWRAARTALDEGAPDAALVILDGAVDKGALEWQALSDEAARAAPGPR